MKYKKGMVYYASIILTYSEGRIGMLRIYTEEAYLDSGTGTGPTRLAVQGTGA
jgi:hypothetical protein